MARTSVKEPDITDTPKGETDGYAEKYIQLTGADSETGQTWKAEDGRAQQEEADWSSLPTPEQIKKRIVKRVYEIIDTCTDPKKLMDTYEAISRYERETGENKTSLFEEIEEGLIV